MKKLIIAPHIDDDVLGCGGIIDPDTFVLYCGMDEQHIPDRPNYNTRLNEAIGVSEFLGNQYDVLNNKVNFYKLQPLLESFEKIISDQQPEEIFIPHPSYNQDHRIVYEAILAALRPHDKNFFVKRVLVYEQPHVFLWDYTDNINGSFKPNYFVPINIEKKIKAYNLMPTQVRNFRSPETLKSIAQLRGQQSNCKYAEAFQIIRWID
jgi:LmbE family N-acetylglucosaminyl deacetylase